MISDQQDDKKAHLNKISQKGEIWMGLNSFMFPLYQIHTVK